MSENTESSNMGPNRFCWNELLSTDVEASKQFYASLFGWGAASFTGGMDYTLFKSDDKDAGGLMKVPQPGMPAQWLPYVVVEDVDASAKKVADLGGQVMAPPFDIPTIGRIAVLIDPQGAAIGIITPQK